MSPKKRAAQVVVFDVEGGVFFTGLSPLATVRNGDGMNDILRVVFCRDHPQHTRARVHASFG